MPHYTKYILTSAAAMLLIVGCQKDPEIKEPEPEIAMHIPRGWPQPHYNFENNQLTKAGFELGRKLFFDGRLSRTNDISCGTCHQPATAFAQIDHAISHGVEDKLGTRNSPPLFNLAWHTNFFWDGGVNHIESQPIAPITNPVEMDEKLNNVVAKLQADDTYKAMFKAAIGDETINTQRISKAITQFQAMLVSANAKYDRVQRGDAAFTEAENRGLAVFKAQCASCHKEPLFTDFTFRNNGLKVTTVNDSGRAHITKLPGDLYKFKVPSLRNLKYSSPYMHDGRFTTLDAVLTHYTSGIIPSPTLDPALAGGIQLSSTQKEDLLQFLNTLNDESFVRDERFKEVR